MINKMNSKYILAQLLVMIFIFTGCEKETTVAPLAKFKINSVKLVAMPALDNNNVGWDLFDDADVFFNIEDANHTIVYDGSSFKVGNLAQADLPVSWSLTSSYQINDINKLVYISVCDYDVLDANDPMGYVGFKMEDYVDGKPTSITKTNGALTITITGVWY